MASKSTVNKTMLAHSPAWSIYLAKRDDFHHLRPIQDDVFILEFNDTHVMHIIQDMSLAQFADGSYRLSVKAQNMVRNICPEFVQKDRAGELVQLFNTWKCIHESARTIEREFSKHFPLDDALLLKRHEKEWPDFAVNVMVHNHYKYRKPKMRDLSYLSIHELIDTHNYGDVRGVTLSTANGRDAIMPFSHKYDTGEPVVLTNYKRFYILFARYERGKLTLVFENTGTYNEPGFADPLTFTEEDMPRKQLISAAKIINAACNMMCFSATQNVNTFVQQAKCLVTNPVT